MSDDPFADAPATPDAAAVPADPLASDPLGDAAAPLGGPQSQPAAQQPRTQKPRSNVYTMMLIISFAAIVTACVLLWLRLQPYGEFGIWWVFPPEVSSEVSS